jgi:hypothetical protein
MYVNDNEIYCMYTNMNYTDKHERFKIPFSLCNIISHSAVNLSDALNLSDGLDYLIMAM